MQLWVDLPCLTRLLKLKFWFHSHHKHTLMNTFYDNLAGKLRNAPQPLPSIAVGFDGFVDEMISVVAERQNLSAFQPVPDIGTFGGLISKAAGHSSLREIVVTAVHPGGCTINLGDGLAALGVAVDAFATLGNPVHAAFAPIVAGFRSTRSWGPDPGRTLAFEFQDGKLMFSSVSPLSDFTPGHVRELLMTGDYAKACANARIIALTNWSLFPHMTGIWRLLQDEVFSQLKHRPAFFIDLVDPSSRSSSDIRAMLECLPGFSAAGTLSLGLNGNEAGILARLCGLRDAAATPQEAVEQAAGLRERLRIHEVVIHQNHFAAVSSKTESASLETLYCAHPKKSTGAGDRFNAGYCLGLLLNLDARERLACGNACSSFFVHEARSATLAELAGFMPRFKCCQARV
jgi:hypothetical protein